MTSTAPETVRPPAMWKTRLFWICAGLYLLLPWLTRYPPLVDFPQHVAQVSLLHDLLAGISPWAGMVKLNLTTPYLIGYLPAAALSLVTGPLAACKLMLALAFIGYLYFGSRFLQYFGAPMELRWLLLPAFHGFAWQAGFMTFLTAAPLLFWLLILAHQHSQTPSRASALKLLGLSLFLLFCHLMVFVFAIIIALGMIVGSHYKQPGRVLRLSAPLLTALLTALALTALNSRGESQPEYEVLWDVTPQKLQSILVIATDRHLTAPFLTGITLLMGVLGLFYAVHFLRRADAPFTFPAADVRVVPLLALLGLIVLGPEVIFATEVAPRRFFLFLLPFLAILPRTTPRAMRLMTVLTVALALFSVAYLGLLGRAFYAFQAETATFSEATADVPPARRALYLVYEDEYAWQPYGRAYGNHALYYQVEKQGWVDFNFAAFWPQVVRFRDPPAVNLHRMSWVEGPPQPLDGPAYQTGNYRYFFIRHRRPLPPDFFSQLGCTVTLNQQSGYWSVYEQHCSQER